MADFCGAATAEASGITGYVSHKAVRHAGAGGEDAVRGVAETREARRVARATGRFRVSSSTSSTSSSITDGRREGNNARKSEEGE